MAICSRCGAAVPNEREFCTICGVSMSPPEAEQETGARYMGTYRQPRAEGGYATRDPAYVYTNPENRPLNVLGTGGFLGSIILMGIPIIGFIISIVWACGGTSSLNRRNHARANLILTFIIIVVLVALYFAIGAMIGMPLIDVLDALLKT